MVTSCKVKLFAVNETCLSASFIHTILCWNKISGACQVELYYESDIPLNKNLIQEEVKRRLNSDNACYHSIQNPLSSSLLSKNFKIRLCKTIILSVVLYGCETLSLTLREEHRLRLFENGTEETTRKTRHRWEDNIKMDQRNGMGLYGLD
jgi:hypothetical protein